MPQTIPQKQAAIVEELNAYSDWSDRYKHIIELGKQLNNLPEELHQEEYRVAGCQSQVWIHAQLEEKQRVVYLADSDALIVKGLVALLLRVYSGHTPQEILTHPPDFFREVGMQAHLSPTRANGLARIVKQIQLYALAFQTLQTQQGANGS